MSNRLTDDMRARLDLVVAELNTHEKAQHEARGYTFPPDLWHWEDRGIKFVHINCKDSGAFMCEKATGELFNIQGYGKPDRNKKQKADIGNIFTVDPARLHKQRHNYLR